MFVNNKTKVMMVLRMFYAKKKVATQLFTYFTFLNNEKMHDLDAADKKLLQLLQQNNRLTTDELGELVSLSSSAVQRRLKRLRDLRIIEADVSIVSPSAAGIGITCVVDIVLEVGNSKAIDRFKITMCKCEEVMQCYYVTGSYDFVVIMNARDMSHYEEFSKKNFMDNPNVKHFYTHVVMDRVKVGYRISI